MFGSLMAGIFGFVLAMPAHAQMMNPEQPQAASPAESTVAEVQTDSGVIMVSDGGAYQTAVPGQRVSAKSRLMVSKESSATVIYDDGCEKKYTDPGVYDISAECVLPPVAVASSGAPTALKVGAVIVATYAAYEIYDRYIDDDDDDDSSPISP
jgi:hypothetical protein